MMNLQSQLKANPLNYVKRLGSPIGIYVRREVLKQEAETDAAQRRTLRGKIVAEQSTDGSWDHMFVKTANNLWNLALLGYSAEDERVRRGLEWVRSLQTHSYRDIYPGFFYSNTRRDCRAMRLALYGEFGPGCSLFYQTTYAVHLFHIFGFDDDSQIKTTVRSYLQIWGDQEGYCSAWCTLNVLRILIEHPLGRESKQVENGLRGLAKRQNELGGWTRFPFHHTFHALSKAQSPSARKQLEKALPSAIRRQKKDGSWAGETRTYLILDALKNMDAI